MSSQDLPLAAAALSAKLSDKTAQIGILGLGYVGLPLALACTGAGFRVLGFDVDQGKTQQLNAGRSYIGDVSDGAVKAMRENGLFDATDDFARAGEPDAILICVPTPLNKTREPDLSYVEASTRAILPSLREGQLVVLESTTWPGTTEEIVRPILEESGLGCGTEFFLAFSPEREDPGNIDFSTSQIPKVVGGEGPVARELARQLYDAFVISTVVVSDAKTAEAVKLTENIFRAVNVALVNELKVVYDKMGIDVWEVIEAAKTKPFGYMPFYPGPGLGGHCIPIDPFYLTWKAREHEISTRFIELAGEINNAMPDYVVRKLARALDDKLGLSLSRAKVLVVGMAYKKNVNDLRESPALKVIALLKERGVEVDYMDPFFPEVPDTRNYPDLAGMKRVEPDDAALAEYSAAVIVTDHDDVDYEQIAKAVPVIVDSRNATNGLSGFADKIVKA
ncbi:MAG: nucleotide sugar dehydrogenase [Alphaproteobacteria bacterium]|nr:nucleotide sugar dehydrogenase [Alphaproteobacteria bacterium]